jgi:GNAT superfamily N-acetyltransferase/catechol 2,3-dioxygenase-like lactoylglutathione lyase family enzyme
MEASPRIWSIEDAPTERDVAALSDAVTQFGRREAAGGDPQPIACFLREDGKVIAGACGRTEFNRLFVNYLWVAEELRGRGLGTEALLRIERAASERGARDSLIEALSERTANLYRRLGYRKIASVEEYVGRFPKHILVKDLAVPGAKESDEILIEGIEHIQLAMPTGKEAIAREFYGELLGLPEVSKPPELAKRGGVWFERGSLKVHLGVELDFRPARKAHPALLVTNLKKLIERLVASRIDVVEEPMGGYFRAYVADPFGNRIELMERRV